jgi:peptidyl-dipeptidase A
MRNLLLITASAIVLTLGACEANTSTTPSNSANTETPSTAETEPTLQEAKEFLEAAETEVSDLSDYAGKVYWINANFITEDTDALASKVGAEWALLSTKLANGAKRFNGLSLPADMARKMDGLKRGSEFPAPEKPGAAEELSSLMTSLNSTYGKGKFEFKSDDPKFAALYETYADGVLPLGALSEIIAKSRNPEELQAVWEKWREVSPPMKDDYVRMVEIINEGASELGFADAGALWRSGYDMPADDFVKEADRIWDQVKPLYDELHCYVRAGLNKEYGDEVAPMDAPIRADLLGNMWGQQWGNIYDIVAPEGVEPGVDLTKLIEESGWDEIEMVKIGEQFFSSLGFDPLPDTFWERSLFLKPKDRDVVCHASAWDLDNRDDIRIKMCIKRNGEDFVTIHHELGHNYYQRAYKDQSIFYKDGANDGFHEAIGDMIALSITPDYLVKVGLLDKDNMPSENADLDMLLRQAMDKVAFLPFGLMVDQWRWKVFNGEYSPSEYNSGWWELREKYQGLRAPGDRPSNAFDPGAKYHIPGNTPYMRYFLAHILQFQFHKAACDMAGFEGPLHRCSIYDNKEVGAKFNAMMEMGASKPWPDALEAFTGTRDMDGSAILEYFAPVMTYLKDQNKDRTCGW